MARLRKEKKAFVEAMTKEADNIRALRAIVQNVVVPSIRRFNARVLNKKLCDHIKETANDPFVSASICTENGGKKVLKVQRHTFVQGYNDYDEFSVEIKFMRFDTSCTARIDAEKTIDIEAITRWLDSRRESADMCDDAIANFDKYFEMAQKLQAEIDEWGKVNYHFRHNIRFFVPYSFD